MDFILYFCSMKKAIYEFNFFYSFLLPGVNYATRCHYRHIDVRGTERLPEDGPYILAPCHQSALMDPLVVLQALGGPIVFLARADIFAKPAARAALTFLRIMPAYRIRDGRDQLGRNAETFGKSVEVLTHGVPLCLMAEGTHNDRHQLRPLVKGMFRIAGEAWKAINGVGENAPEFDFEGSKPLYIVPVGLDYDEYEQPYSSVAMTVGTPIDVRPFMQDFLANEPVALNHMRDALTKGLKSVMHHVGSMDRYDSEYAYCHLRTQEVVQRLGLPDSVSGRSVARRFVSSQLAHMDEAQRQQCYDEGDAFAADCRRRRVPLWFASRRWTLKKGVLTLAAEVLLLIVVWPMLPWWLLANPVVYLPTLLVVKKWIKDPQFRSSIDYGLRMLLTALYLIGLFVGCCIASGLFYALLMVLLGLLSARLTPLLYALTRDAIYALIDKGTCKSA